MLSGKINAIKNILLGIFGCGDLIYRNTSYSQNGEDIILSRIFNGKNDGFYVDIGAHHPFRFSNTFLFYNKGWNGINVDATPGSMKLFRKYRSRDINLETAVSKNGGVARFRVFDESALNGFQNSLTESYIKSGNKLVAEINVKTITLKDVFKKHLPKDKTIDFISIDAEDSDYDILRSNDWKLYRPTVVVVEELSIDNHDQLATDSRIHKFMVNQNYNLYCKVFSSLIYRSKT